MSISTTPTCHTRRSKDGRPLTKCIFLKVPRCQNNSKRPESLQGKHGENRIWLNDAIPVSPKRKLSQSIQRKPIPPNRNYRSKRRRAQKTNCLSFRNVTQNQVQNHPSNAIPSEEIPNSNRKIDLSRQLRTLPCISKTNCRVLVHKTPDCLGRMHGFAYSIARKLTFTEPIFIANLLANPSSDFLHHTVSIEKRKRSKTLWRKRREYAVPMQASRSNPPVQHSVRIQRPIMPSSVLL